MAFKVLRFNRDNDAQQDVIRNVDVVTFTDVLSGAGSGSFSIPRDSDQLPDLTFGTTIRVISGDGTHAWTGIVSGTVQMADTNAITIPLDGLMRRLNDFMYPPNMVIDGDASVDLTKARLTQCYNWRTVTANRTVDTGSVDSDSVVSLGGNTTTGTTGRILTNTIIWDVYDVSDDDDSSGVLTISGVDSSGDGTTNDPPYSSTGTYQGPYLNFVDPVGLLSSTASVLDRLRYGGAWTVDTEVRYKVTTHASTGNARSTRITNSAATETDPEGVGADISAVSSNNYVEVQFFFEPDDVDSSGVMIQWYQVVERQVIPGVVAGNFPAKDFENQMDVGGRTLLDVLETISDTFSFEFRIRPTGEIDMQTAPLDNQWVLTCNAASFTGAWTVGDEVTGGTSGATASVKAWEEDDDDVIRIGNTTGIPPVFTVGETLTADSGGTATYASILAGTFWGVDRQNEFHLIDETHCNITSFTLDDGEIVNYLAGIGTGSGQNAVEVILQNDASQIAYGVRQKSVKFGVPLIPDLKLEAADYLNARAEPRKAMSIHLIDHPSIDSTLEVGDRIRVTSTKLTGFDGNPIDERLRVMTKTVTESSVGCQVTLLLESLPGTRSFTAAIAKSLVRTDSDLARTVGGIQMSVMETDVISTHTNSTDFTIRLPFQPVDMTARVVEVYDDVGEAWYTPSSGPNTIRVTKELLGDRHITFGIREIDGASNNYAARIEWSAWGDVTRSGSLGR